MYRDVSQISAYRHAVALTSDRVIWSWGLNSSGQMGDGTTTASWPYAVETPVQASPF